MFRGVEGQKYLKKENDWSICFIQLWSVREKPHLVQPSHFTEEHGNLRGGVSNPRFGESGRVVLHWGIVSPSKTKAMIYTSLKLHSSKNSVFPTINAL